MQWQTEAEEPGFFEMLVGKYEAIWKSVILPPRRDFCLEMLGPTLRRVDADSVFKRRDVVVLNARGEGVCLSFFELLSLDGRQRLSRRCLLYLHTHGANRLEGLSLAKEAASLGLHFCCFDFAGSGKSEGRFTTLGVRESDDCRAVMGHLQREFAVESFVLWGRSMGAVSAILACAGTRPPVECLVLDSPFADVEHLVRDAGNSFVALGEYLALAVFSFVRDDIKQQLGHDLGNLRPLDSCKDCDVPSVFVAAKDDQLVPLARVREMFEHLKASDKCFLEIEGTHSSERKPADIQKIVAQIKRLTRKTEAGLSAGIPYAFEARKPNLQLLPATQRQITAADNTSDHSHLLKHSKSQQLADAGYWPDRSDRPLMHPLQPQAVSRADRSHVSSMQDDCKPRTFMQRIASKPSLLPNSQDSRKNTDIQLSAACGSPGQAERDGGQFRHHKPFNSGERRLMATLRSKLSSARPVHPAFDSNDRSSETPMHSGGSPKLCTSPADMSDYTATLAHKIKLQATHASHHLKPQLSATSFAYHTSHLDHRTLNSTCIASKRTAGPKPAPEPLTADQSVLQPAPRSSKAFRQTSTDHPLNSRPKPQIFSPEKHLDHREVTLAHVSASRPVLQEPRPANMLASKLTSLQPTISFRRCHEQSKENSPSSPVHPPSHPTQTHLGHQRLLASSQQQRTAASRTTREPHRDVHIRIFEDLRVDR